MVAAGDQQEETIPRRAPADLKLSCLPFWTFVYQEAAGTHWALAQLYELCHQWLRPEVHSQEQMLELLVLEQFLSILAYKVLLSVEVQHHESCKKAVSLVEDLTKALEEPEAEVSRGASVPGGVGAPGRSRGEPGDLTETALVGRDTPPAASTPSSILFQNCWPGAS
uniref:SCAN box domain-containing protein n=1 Tax=Equus caballus TaxID=9796 RepID=A0A9L0SHA4_HORSE